MAKGKASRAQAAWPHRPRIWLMTDPRMGDAVLRSAQALPFGSVILLRHYDWPEAQRHHLFRQLRRIARRRGHGLFLADQPAKARRWGADGVHHPGRPKRTQGRIKRSAPVHDRQEWLAAQAGKTDWVLISPVYPTRTHPGAKTLGAHGLRALAVTAARQSQVVALGGMTRARYTMMRALPIDGWAAIDALTRR